MKRHFYLIAVVLFLLIFISIFPSCKKEPNVIKIGAVLPLTGDNAQWGIPPRKGAQLAIDQINNEGGINGIKIEFLVEDGRCEPKEGVSAFNKLAAQKDLKIVLGEACSSVTLAIAPIAEKNRIILISPASTNPKITQAGEYIFRVIPSDDFRGKVFAEYLFSDQKIKSIGMLYINNEGGVGNKDAFAHRFSELGGKIIIEESYDQDSSDMRSQLTKLKSSKIEAIFIVSYLADSALLMKQSKELGITFPLYFQTEAIEDPNVLKTAGDASEGVTYILPAPAKGENPVAFINKYREKYNVEPELYAAEAYDIINLCADAIRAQEGNFLSSDKIRDYLYSVKNYPGASGIITFDKNGDVSKPMAIKKIIKGKPEIISIK